MYYINSMMCDDVYSSHSEVVDGTCSQVTLEAELKLRLQAKGPRGAFALIIDLLQHLCLLNYI